MSAVVQEFRRRECVAEERMIVFVWGHVGLFQLHVFGDWAVRTSFSLEGRDECPGLLSLIQLQPENYL